VLNFASLEAQYAQFVPQAKKFGFFPGTPRELSAIVRGYHLVRPKSRNYQEPGEICWVYVPPEQERNKGNDYIVVVWTTKREEGFVTSDQGWVIILNGKNEKVYTSAPFVRTNENFFEDLLKEARVARWRVFYRPFHCEKFMLLARGKYLKSRFWQCREHPHVRDHNRRFDDLRKPLPPEEQSARDKKRSQRRSRRERVREKGGDPFTALKKRIKHPWVKKQITAEPRF